jgi:DNA-binding transcriptional LysR family regulator
VEIAIRHLRVLEALKREGSFRRAAAWLGMGQPTLSRQVARIEKELGVELVRRSAAGVVLTEAGLLATRYAEVINGTFNDLIRELNEHKGNPTGVLRLAASLTPGITTEYLVNNGYRVQARHAVDVEAIRLVECGEVDLALVVVDDAEDFHPPHGVKAATIQRAPLWAALWDGHPAATRGRLHLADLAAESWVASPGGTRRSLTDAACIRAGFVPRVRLTGDTEALLTAVEHGLGIGLTEALSGELYGCHVAMRPVGDAPVERKLCLWRPESLDTGVVAAIVDEVQQRYRVLAPRLPEYATWMRTAPGAMPDFVGEAR